MIVDQLVVRNFRGIRDDFVLNLTAPITVLLAANGTAKTSLCDALEWLLTGDLQRFSSESIEVANQYRKPGSPVEVLANLNTINEKIVVRRTLENGTNILWSGDRKRKDEWLLGQITPALAETKPAKLRAAQCDWIRAAHFFGPENLGNLVDNDADGHEARTALFASLAGAGRLRSAHERLQKVLDKIESPLPHVVEEEERAIVELKEALAGVAERDSAGHLAQFDALAGEWLRGVGGPPLAGFENLSARQQWLAEWRDRVTVFCDSLRQKIERLEKLGAEFTDIESSKTRENLENWKMSERPRYLGAMKESVRRIDIKAEEATRLEDSIKARKAERARLEAAIKLHREDADKLARARQILENCREEFQLWWSRSTREIESQAYAAGGRLQELYDRKKRFSEALTKEPEAAVAHRRGNELAIAISLNQKEQLSPETRASILQKLNNLGLVEVTLLRARERLQDSWNVWFAQTRELLARRPESSTCPLCAHDHGSAAGLNHAFEHMVREFAPALIEKEENITHLLRVQKESHDLSAQLRADDQMRDKEALLQADLRATTETQAKFRALYEELISDGPSWPTEAATATLTQAIDAISTSAAEEELLFARLRLLHLALRDAARLVYENKHGDVSDLTVEQIYSSLIDQQKKTGNAQHMAEEKIGNIHAADADEVPRLAELQSSLSEARKTHGKEKEKFAALEVEYNKYELRLEAAAKEARYLLVSPESSFMVAELLEKARQNIRRSEDAYAPLLVIQKRLDIAVIAEERARKHSDLTQRIAEKEAELERRKRVAANRSILVARVETLKMQLNHAISDGFAPYTNAANALFLRSQANAHVERLDFSSPGDGGTPQLQAHLPGQRKSLRPVELSQGQRQDAALAIFLARAQAEGGTFILDEPLSHLDDLNRVALIDVLRALVMTNYLAKKESRFVVTTASRALVRHIRAKFHHVMDRERDEPLLRVVELVGNPMTSLKVE